MYRNVYLNVQRMHAKVWAKLKWATSLFNEKCQDTKIIIHFEKMYSKLKLTRKKEESQPKCISSKMLRLMHHLSLSLSLSLAPSFYRCCVLFAVILRFGIMTPQHLCCAYHLRLPLPKHLFHQMKAIVSLCMLSSISIRNANENACTHFFLFHRNDKMHFNEKLF